MTSASGAAHGATFLVTIRWYCPNCRKEAVSHDGRPNALEFHHCPRLGIYAPMVRAGTKAKVEAKEREDYVAGETLRYNDAGRPITHIQTTRDNGSDAVVFAPLAKGSLKGA